MGREFSETKTSIRNNKTLKYKETLRMYLLEKEKLRLTVNWAMVFLTSWLIGRKMKMFIS
jgi:hypothetical protein